MLSILLQSSALVAAFGIVTFGVGCVLLKESVVKVGAAFTIVGLTCLLFTLCGAVIKGSF